MDIFDYKEKIIKFIICINILLLVLLVLKNLFFKESNDIEYNSITTSLIKTESETTNIYVEYPRFNGNDEVNKIVTDILYNYIKDFKNHEDIKSLDITYKTYFIEDYVNITFHIENTLNKIKTKNIIINLKTNQLSYITSLFDKDYLENEIDKLVYDKYYTEVYNRILNENINNYTYLISDDEIEVYFNNLDWEDFDYIPYVTINLNEKISYTNSTKSKKYIAFTYDDGPSDYTLDLLEVLESNKSSATFFVIGNNVKGREDIIKEIHKSKSEVASHGYSHTNLTKLNHEDLKSEVNSTNLLINSITKGNNKLIRPPYGDYNEELVKLNYSIILWNIDSKDWVVKDTDKIYNNVISNACDGCIVLMHDIYEESIEATKKLIPELNNLGYSVVSISELMKIKKYHSEKNSIISYIK